MGNSAGAAPFAASTGRPDISSRTERMTPPHQPSHYRSRCGRVALLNRLSRRHPSNVSPPSIVRAPPDRRAPCRPRRQAGGFPTGLTQSAQAKCLTFAGTVPIRLLAVWTLLGEHAYLRWSRPGYADDLIRDVHCSERQIRATTRPTPRAQSRHCRVSLFDSGGGDTDAHCLQLRALVQQTTPLRIAVRMAVQCSEPRSEHAPNVSLRQVFPATSSTRTLTAQIEPLIPDRICPKIVKPPLAPRW